MTAGGAQVAGDSTVMRALLKTALFTLVPSRRLMRRSRGPSVYLTFDDGPYAAGTERILDILKDKGAPATFFVVSRAVERYPDVARRIVREGHAIGGHSWSHKRSAQLAVGEVWWEFARTRAVIRATCGISTRLYRPPYGHLTAALLLYSILGRIRVVLWSIDTHDDATQSVENILRSAERAEPGDILLLHDDCPQTVEALPRLIDRLREKGLDLGALDHG